KSRPPGCRPRPVRHSDTRNGRVTNCAKEGVRVALASKRKHSTTEGDSEMANIKVNYHGLEFTPSSWAEVVAMDASGRVYEYASTPIKKEAHDAWAPTGRYKYVGFLNRHPVDWRDSLIRIVDAHPHADNMALYVEDARETPKPWLRWQLRYKLGGKWEDCYTHPDWSPFWEYRRKPAIKTHVVNGFEVPAPET